MVYIRYKTKVIDDQTYAWLWLGEFNVTEGLHK